VNAIDALINLCYEDALFFIADEVIGNEDDILYSHPQGAFYSVLKLPVDNAERFSDRGYNCTGSTCRRFLPKPRKRDR
jgi:hypothetical protein